MSARRFLSSQLLSQSQEHRDTARVLAAGAISFLKDGRYSEGATEAHRAHQHKLIADALDLEATRISDAPDWSI